LRLKLRAPTHPLARAHGSALESSKIGCTFQFGALWSTLVHFAHTFQFGALWSTFHFDAHIPIWCTLVRTLVHFGAHFGSTLVHFGANFGSTLVHYGARFGSTLVRTLGPLWFHFGSTLVRTLVHLGPLWCTLVRTLVHFGCTKETTGCVLW
jgi:hypothetical protein